MSSTLEARIEALEQSLRTYRRLAAGAVLLMVVLLTLGAARQDPPSVPDFDELEVQRLSIVNEAGIPVVELHAGRKGGGLVAVRSDQGALTTLITHDVAWSGSLTTYTSEGARLVSLGATGRNEGTVTTLGPSGKDLVRLSAIHDMGGAVEVFDPEGRPACTLYVDELGRGEVGAWGPTGAGETLGPSDG